ncbi:TPA: fimbrial biogenesis chaperone [Klebsiella variicola]|uniref:fimbrial biogenesis chaperone n=1 Tax=Klebsiella variicola TaxID=244366 RepID=UPI000A37238A|nr:molecular chaperone [Klebsiella variicola]HCB0069028.1 molecular chaperone [Klebsiella variicola subsp. variicola]EKZ5805065.1 molecular chaperone [Klebsiella variicola]MBA6161076.1 molecular chaperone [Klebsiella variicola]MBF8477951.1 molecular chaperone [Klebsiella variicola]MCE7437014.1 molecular chaperone [Klebsiella variicola]
MMKKIIAVAAFLLCSTAAQAGIVMGGTRVIYQEGKREAAISVTNADTHTPYLVQSWVENYAENDKSKVPFIVTPPLFRLDPEQNNVLRINFIGASLPGDRESVFWLNVKSISPTPQGEVNKLQVNIKSKFKIFYRPNGLAGDPAKAWQQLKFTQSGSHLTVANPTPYFVSFYSVAVGGQSIDEPGMVAPFGQKTWPVSGHGAVKWRAINDYGGVSDFAQQ